MIKTCLDCAGDWVQGASWVAAAAACVELVHHLRKADTIQGICCRQLVANPVCTCLALHVDQDWVRVELVR